MRLLADEHVPPAIVSALRGEGHDVAVVGQQIDYGAADAVLVEYARETDRRILAEDTDFLGADPQLDIEDHPGILVCDMTAQPGTIAASIRRIEAHTDDLSGAVLHVPGSWL